MGILQVGWLSVNTWVSTTFILNGFGSKAGPGSLPFLVIAAIWAYGLAYVGVKGIQYVARFALYLNFIPLLMILIVFFRTAGAAGEFVPTEGNPYVGFMLLIQMVVGFFATAGAAGADFAMNNRDARDVRWGGLVGITLAILIAGGLPLISVAGARVLYNLESLRYDAVISAMGGFLATAMFFLFAIASIPPACFTSFIMGNSFATMIPGVPRLGSSMAGATVAFLLAVTGAAGNLIGLFTVIGASFGPICGAILADYLLAGKKWAGPREGVSIPGYAAWAVGFVIGILPFLPISEATKAYVQPAAVYSFIAGFVVYAALAKAGLEPKTVPMTSAAAAD
jgi:cytosine permease